MTCQISYYSPQGHAGELARSFRRIFPSQTPVVDLVKECPRERDVHLVGFEFPDIRFDTIPATVQNFLAQLENKEIMLFATAPVPVSEAARRSIETSLVPLIPKNCRYHGLFLCQGEVYLTVVEDLLHRISQSPDHEKEKTLLREYRKGKGHPNREDVRRGYRFIADTFSPQVFR